MKSQGPKTRSRKNIKDGETSIRVKQVCNTQKKKTM